MAADGVESLVKEGKEKNVQLREVLQFKMPSVVCQNFDNLLFDLGHVMAEEKKIS